MKVDTGPETRPSLIQDFGDPSKVKRRRKFIEIYQPLLVRYVCAKGLSETDAQDVIQDVWVRLLKYLPKFRYDPDRRFRSWLWSVTMSAYGDWGRDRGKLPASADVETFPSPDAGDPIFMRDFRRHVLKRVLDELEPTIQPKTWTCFQEYLLKNRRANDIAGDGRLQLDITADAVVANANRVLKKVRALCLEYAEEDLANLVIP